MLAGFVLHLALSALNPESAREANGLPYGPWQPGTPLPDPRLPPQPESGRLLPGQNYDRRPFAASLAVAALPLECLNPEGACGSHSAELAFSWRVVPRYAWALALERTEVGDSRVWFGSLGALVYALEEGPFDPYLGLDLGLESTGRSGGFQVAGTISFGVHLHLLEHLEFGPLLKLRHSERRWSACPGATRSCDDAWSATGERWLMLGWVLSIPLGVPH
jgi:hypothetical protein